MTDPVCTRSSACALEQRDQRHVSASAKCLQDGERHGEIVAEFFDIGHSRSIPWKRRPEAARLLEAM